MSNEIKKTSAEYEASEGRIALWLSAEDLKWLAGRCCCTDSSSEAEKERCGRVRFRASAALHKSKPRAAGGKVKCGCCGSYPGALVYGQVYDVLNEDLEKRQYRIKGSNGRTRWFPAYCFVPLDHPTPRFTSFEVNEVEDDVIDITLNVT